MQQSISFIDTVKFTLYTNGVPRAALTEAELDAFRLRILDAAERLFATDGYRAVTMRAIAAELGCSAMTPYRYFEGKDEIFALVRAAAFARFADAQSAAIGRVHDPAERLTALASAYIRFALCEPDAYRIMFELHQDPADEHAELVRQGERAWLPLRESVASAIDAGLLAGDVDVVAHVFWAAVHGLVTLHLAGKLALGLELDDLVEPLLTSVFAGAKAPGVTPDMLPQPGAYGLARAKNVRSQSVTKNE
jgi:AcrR family transcriptional regulator